MRFHFALICVVQLQYGRYTGSIVVVTLKEMAPTAEHEGKFYPTRFRERMAIQKKYDDIFSCVVEKALMVTSDRPTTPSLSKSKYDFYSL
ncbi:hypothetical protein ANCCAN_21204 [Ancylostoma caninum]|uniref:Uncharacterized protein n=1 Tax=Ancylostoma caninum TaxID=29170 RepID=A0A368FQ88_ANCCA|nr:hypothetical protein ANCCAN_21204 [Ancylostoma caninum]